MDKRGISLISTRSLEILPFPVTEKINKKYLHGFFSNALSKHIISNKENIAYFYNFNEIKSCYEVVIFKKNGSYNIPEPLLLFELYKENFDNDKVVLFYTNDFFIVLKSNRVLCFHHIKDEIDVKDLQNYLNQAYEIVVDEICFVPRSTLKQLFEELKDDKKFYRSLPIHNLHKTNSYFYFMMFIILGFIITFYTILNQNDPQDLQHQELLILEKKYENLQNKQYSNSLKSIEKLQNIFRQMKQYNLTCQKITMKNKKFIISINGSKKDQLINFSKEFSNGFHITKFSFDQKQKIYQMDFEYDI